MYRGWTLVTFPVLACGLGLAQHGGPGTALQRTGPPAAAAGKALPSSSSYPRSARSPGGVPQKHRKIELPKNVRQPYRERYPYSYGGTTAVIPGFPLAYGGNYIDEPADAALAQQPPPNQDDGREGPAPEVAANTDAPRFRPLYQGADTFAPVQPQPATTLIFKGSRPAMLVHNYALTASTLYALDGESRQEIPLSLLNVPATIEVNRTAGVAFALPRTP